MIRPLPSGHGADADPGNIPAPVSARPLALLRDPERCVARVRAGDVAAFDELFRACWSPLCAFAMLYLRDENAAADVVAEVFAALWRTRTTWSVRTTVEAYLYAAVRHRALNARRTTARRSRHYTALEQERDASAAPTLPPGADVLVESRERHAIVARALTTLPARYRLVLALRWQQQMQWPEVAEALGISQAAAMMLHCRALKALRAAVPAYLE